MYNISEQILGRIWYVSDVHCFIARTEGDLTFWLPYFSQITLECSKSSLLPLLS